MARRLVVDVAAEVTQRLHILFPPLFFWKGQSELKHAYNIVNGSLSFTLRDRMSIKYFCLSTCVFIMTTSGVDLHRVAA